MKNIITIFVLTFISFCSIQAQELNNLLNTLPTDLSSVPEYRLMMEDMSISYYEVEESFEQYWAVKGRRPGEGEGGAEYSRYLDYMKSNSDENGVFKPTKKTPEYWREIRNSRQGSSLRSSANANWTPIGPNAIDPGEDHNNSRMHSIYQDPNNYNLLWAGGGTAGVWKSIDDGNSWTCLSNNLEEARNIDAVIPDRMDHNHVFVASRTNGLFITSDDGANWTKVSGITQAHKVEQHAVDPMIWYASTDSGFYTSTDNGVNWVLLYATDLLHDFEIHPTHPDTIYILEETNDANGQNQHLYRSFDGGATFVLLTTDLPLDTEGDFVRAEIAVTPHAPNMLCIVYAEKINNGLYGVYISHDAGNSFTFQCCGGTPGGPYVAGSNPNILGYSKVGSTKGGQLNYQQSLFISPTDSTLIISGGVFLWKSTNMGSSWSVVQNTYHSDNHAVLINTSGDIYTASDGGIHKSTDGGVVFNSLTDGIYGTEFIGDFGFSRKNADVMIGGTLHNGSVGKYENNYSDWQFYAGGDLREGLVDMSQAVYRVSPNSNGNKIRRSKNGGASFTLLSKASRFIVTHPHTPSTLYAPDQGLFNLWKSEDAGISWTQLTNFPNPSVGIYDIEICESQPDNIALNLRNNREIAVSSDGGQTWAIKPIPNHGVRKLNDLIVDHMDPLTMWIVYDRSFVYKTIDGGDNWISYYSGIPNLNKLQCITHHVGSNGAVYLGGDDMVYYRDNSMTDWIGYSVGLPFFIDIKDIEIIYAIDKIRISSNRSVWESDICSTATPLAAISADKLLLSDCEDILLQYYDASFVPTSGTSWNWTFEGGSPATSTMQNPQIAYTMPGSYDVTLEITNNGMTSTKTITDFVTVETFDAALLPIVEDIENFVFSGTTGGCSPNVPLAGSLTNLYTIDFTSDNTDWRVNSGNTTGISGPIVDYTEGTSSGQYIYLRGTGGCNMKTGALITDCLDLNNATEPKLKFAYHAMNKNSVATPELHVDIYSNGFWTTDEMVIVGEHGTRTGTAADWELFELDLTAYVNTLVKIRIWGITSTDGVKCDVALDGIEVYESRCTVVNNTNDDGPGSLRAAIACATAGDTISFSTGIYADTISITSVPLILNKDLYILSSMAEDITISSVIPQVSTLEHIFMIDNGTNVKLSHLKILGAFGPVGSCIKNAGILTLDQVELSNGGNTNVSSTIQNVSSGATTFEHQNKISE